MLIPIVTTPLEFVRREGPGCITDRCTHWCSGECIDGLNCIDGRVL